MSTITKPHDHYFKTSMRDLRVAKDFFQNHLPKKVLDSIDLNSIKLCNESFIDKDFSEKITDILYSVDYANHPCYLYILSEHQSEPEPLLAFKLLSYAVRIMDFHVYKLGHKKLPVVIPLVFYNGQQKYSYSTNIFDSFADPEQLASELMFKSFILIDVGQIDDAELRTHQWSGIMEIMMKHVRSRDILTFFKSMIKPMKIVVFRDGERYIIETANYLFHESGLEDKNRLITLVREGISKDTGEKIMTVAERLRQEGKQEAQQNIVRQLLNENVDIQIIMRTTNLSLKEIQQIQEAFTDITT